MIRPNLSKLIISSVEKLYRYAPVKLTSWLLFTFSYVSLKRSPLFDEKFYLSSNPDVAESGQDPVLHYLRRGAIEANNPNPWFDTSYYMASHPGIISVGINPLFHYLLLGAHQGYNPHPLFDTSYYLGENPEVAQSGMNPLSHFMRFGFEAGKIPHPLLKGVSPENYLSESRNKLLTKKMLDLYDVTPEKISWRKRNVESINFKPQITLVLFGEPDYEKLTKSVESISAQTYPFWNLVIVTGQDSNLESDPQSLSSERFCDHTKAAFLSEQSLLESSDWVIGQFLAFLRCGDTLTAEALFELVKELNCNPKCDLIYPDECRINIEGQTEFFFKPGWSPDLLWGTNYIGDFFLLKKTAFDEIGGLNAIPSRGGLYELLLKISQCFSHVIRLPKPLVQCHISGQDSRDFVQQFLQKSLESLGQAGEIIPLEIPGTYRVKRKIKDAPLVSIIIPTAFSNPNENLFPCLRTIIEKTSYSNREIIIIDNSHGKLLADCIHGIVPASEKMRIIEYNSHFNYSTIMNRGVAETHGEYLLMLNDDIEVVSPDWIESMLEYAQQTDVGVVGAKLLYPNGKVQHAGCFITDNRGYNRHAFQFMPDEPDLYFGIGSVARNCSFVTFACVMIRKDLFLELGQLDEGFDVEQNDSDYCLRNIAAGYRIVYTPFATLIHKDARSRSETKKIKVSRNIQKFSQKWMDIVEGGDPYYNPNLTLDAPDFGISDRPVIMEPLWKGTEQLDMVVDQESEKIVVGPNSPKSRNQVVIGIDPTSSNKMRSWPYDHFARLSDLLLAKLDASVIINTGSEDFRATMDDIDLFIGGLNENTNLAASMGVPTLVIWPGNTGIDDARGQFGDRAMALRMAVPCSPCSKTNQKKCPYDLKCLNMLWPYKVFEAARHVLACFGKEIDKYHMPNHDHVVMAELPGKLT